MRHRPRIPLLTPYRPLHHHQHPHQPTTPLALPPRRHKATRLTAPADLTVTVIEQKFLHPEPSRLLHTTLSDLFTPALAAARAPKFPVWEDRHMPFGHHVGYFSNQPPPSMLLRDGAEAQYIPPELGYDPAGTAPPPRRLWAGGSIYYAPRAANSLRFASVKPLICFEKTVPSKQGYVAGYPAVDVWRQYGLRVELSRKFNFARQQPLIWERRTIVFLPAKDDQAQQKVVQEMAAAAGVPENAVESGPARGGRRGATTTSTTTSKPPLRPRKAELTLTPSQLHLFNFSALSNNSHRIHYDPPYAQSEGHRGLLVHGPLAMMLMSTMGALQLPGRPTPRELMDRPISPPEGWEELEAEIELTQLQEAHQQKKKSKKEKKPKAPKKLGKKKAAARQAAADAKLYRETVRAIQYRNLAPLYCDEPLTVCANWAYDHTLKGPKRDMLQVSGEHDIWIEGATGRLAAKGTVYTSLGPMYPHEATLLQDFWNLNVFES